MSPWVLGVMWAVLVTVTPLCAVDIRAVLDRAVSTDKEIERAGLARQRAELDVARAAARRGATLSLGTSSGDPLAASVDLAVPLSVRLAATPVLSLTLPTPPATNLSVGAPLALDLPTGTFTPALSAEVTQPLGTLLAARTDSGLRTLEEELSLLGAVAAVEARMCAVALRTISRLKNLLELHLEIADMEQQLLDNTDEMARLLALDAEAAREPAYRAADRHRRAAEEDRGRAEQAYALRAARLEAELGVSLRGEMTGLPEGEPQVGVVATNAAVHTAQIEVRLAQARIERSRLSRIPALTARASFGLAAGSTPVSVSLGLWWPVLDGGVRELDREALELELEDRRLSLELARTALAESLEDQVLEAAALRDRIRQADRAQADAAADHLRAEQLEQAGLWTERELARAAYGVTRQAALRRLLAMDVLAFDYRVRALRTAP